MENKVENKHKTANSDLGAVSSRSDVWNPMVKLMNEHPDEDVRAKAKMLLGQYNTAGGRMIKDELEFMLQEHGY